MLFADTDGVMVVAEPRDTAAGAPSGERGTIRPLTSLRFGAALLVFFHHAPLTHWISQRFALGWSGVGFFFLLSGFILTYAYRHAFSGRLRWSAAWQFYAARFSRIYPAYICALFLIAAFLALDGKIDRAHFTAAFVTQALAVQSWIPDIRVYQGLNTVGWSIAVEAFFYALFPLLAAYALQRFRSGPWTLAAIGLIWLTLWKVLALLPIGSWMNWGLYAFPLARLPEFVVGMLLAIALSRQMPRLPRYNPSLLEASVLVSALAMLALSPVVSLPERYAVWMMPWWCAVIGVFAAQRGALSRILSAAPAVYLGEISFAFYLIHPLALLLVARVGLPSDLLAFFASLGVTLAMSAALYHGVERPMRTYLRHALIGPFWPALRHKIFARA